MIFKDNDARSSFLKYGFTSKDREHRIPKSYRDAVLADLRDGRDIEDIDEWFFQTGIINLEKLYGSAVNSKSIDEYFLRKHNKFSRCKALEGGISRVNSKSARVVTVDGESRYSIALTPGLTNGCRVIVHGDYVIKRV